MQDILDNTTDVICSSDVTKNGFHRSILTKMVKDEKIIKISRGIYIKADAWEDEMQLLQIRYSKGIFSHDTALFLHGLTDRTPQYFIMTFPQGYNSPSLKNENVVIKRCIPKFYDMGTTTVKSSFGNDLTAYDVERTLCDIVRGSGSDIQVVKDAMLRYAKSKDKNVLKLMKYADALKVTDKIQRYMEVLL
jgi:predicted transcriptional regulator of viral defense system